MNTSAYKPAAVHTPRCDATSNDLLAVAEALVEAIYKARDGDSPDARARVAYALEHFQQENLRLATGLHLSPANQDMRTTTKPRLRSHPNEHLSARESTVLALIAQGQSNKLVAQTLNLAPETIKSHLKQVFVKLGAKTRAEAVARAAGLGQLALTTPARSTLSVPVCSK